MGLGPPVCQYCELVVKYVEIGQNRQWFCPICKRNTNETKSFLFLYPKGKQSTILENTKLYKFVTSKDSK